MRSLATCIALAALAAAPLLAADPCFCLQDAKDSIWYDCVTRQTGLSSDPFYDCLPSTKALERQTVDGGNLLRQIPAGQAPCDPCRPEAPNARGTMRPMGTDPAGRPGAVP